MLQTPRALLVAAVAIAIVSACDDPTGIRPSSNNLETELQVYAMNGTPIALPAAVAVRSGRAVRIDAAFRFDLAFDINASGLVQVFAQRLVASELAATHRVGLQTRLATFDEVTRAPTSGYVYDSLLTLGPGQLVLVDVLDASCSGSFLGTNVRAKLRVDSVNTSTRSIFLHVLVNPNCGFRSLVQGTPKD